MTEQTKISSKKVVRFSIGLLLVAVFMTALVAASNRQGNEYIKGLDISLNDDHDFSFLQKEDIENLLLKNRHIDLMQTTIAKIDLKSMEDIAKTNPWVAKAEVFVDNRQILKVNITQREPVARVFDVAGRSAYMDSSLHTMPVGLGYAYPVPVFTNVPLLGNDTLQQNLNAKIAYLSETIGRDSFWRAQITQIEVQSDQTFVIVPLFGNQKILLGDTANVNAKLNNLFAFYKNISTKIGWDKYQTLDVRFKGQVVASPSLGWVAPKGADTTGAATLEGPAIMPVAASNIKPTVTNTKVTDNKVVPKEQPLKHKPEAVSKQIISAKVTVAKHKETVKHTENKSSAKYIYTRTQSGNH